MVHEDKQIKFQPIKNSPKWSTPSGDFVGDDFSNA